MQFSQAKRLFVNEQYFAWGPYTHFERDFQVTHHSCSVTRKTRVTRPVDGSHQSEVSRIALGCVTSELYCILLIFVALQNKEH
jgi:hypothetical protein